MPERPITLPLRFTATAGASAPLPPGRLSALLATHGSMSLRYYAPKATDRQVPHEQDEIYVVISGHGRFVVGDQSTPFAPNDVLFARAGAVHRFEEFSNDFAAWVVFYGPIGGE